MAPPVNYIILFVLCLGRPCVGAGQEEVPGAAWLMPGVSWRPAKNIRLQGQLGYNEYFSMGLFYPQAFITVHKNIVLNPAYIYALQKSGNEPLVQEHIGLNAVILQARRKNFSIDDRNMLWNRFPLGEMARHYYRNRFRVTQAFKTWNFTTRLSAFDEIYYSFNQNELARNRVAIGVSVDLTLHLNLDIVCIRQWDKDLGKLNLFFIMAFWQF